MDRRQFLKWLGGGVAAVAAVSTAQVFKVQQLYGVTGEVDPESLLWMPGEAKVIIPQKTLEIVTHQIGVGVYRVTDRFGSYWFDSDLEIVDAFDPKGRPMSILMSSDGVGPNLQELRGYLQSSWRGQDYRQVSPKITISRWRDLYEVGERDVRIAAQLKEG